MADGRGLRSPFRQRYGVGIDPSRVGQVYIGNDYAPYSGGTPTAGYAGRTDMYKPFDVVANSFHSLSPQAQAKVYDQMVEARGYGVPITDAPSFWSDFMVKGAYQVQQSTGIKVQPLEYIDYFKKAVGGRGFNVYDKSGNGGGGGGGAYMGPTTSVTEQVQLTNPSTARGLVEDAIGKYLGRRPDKKEYANFMQALSAYEEESPYVTTSRTERTISSSATKSKTMGGVSPTQFAEEFARSQEGAAELQVATTAYDALIGLLSGQ